MKLVLASAFFVPFFLLWVGTPLSLSAADSPEPSPEQTAFFESKIRPALSQYCYECHSSGEKIRGGLALDSRNGMLAGGDSGPAIVPGQPDSSLLYEAITWAERDTQMPPKNKMPDAVIADFRTWIAMGAPDPRVQETTTVKSAIDVEAGRQFWSFQPPRKGSVPQSKETDWARNDIDRFVLAALESKGLHPVGDADPQSLVRRLHFDLTGLPPSPEEVRAFVHAWNSDPERALAVKTDALLASQSFGERWGRHWLDVARYADSTGKEVNVPFNHAWRYRDYVIDSFNENKPFDRFILEQVAGDLLPVRTDEDFQENLIATGFLAIGTKGLNEPNGRQFLLDVADEQIDTTFQAFQGLTVACARCHDHKTDPIPTADYYALAGIFLSTETFYGTVPSVGNRRATEALLLPISDAVPIKSYSAQEVDGMKQRLAAMETQFAEARAAEVRQRLTGEKGANNLGNIIRLRSQIDLIGSTLKGIDEQGRAKTFAVGVQDRNLPVDVPVLVRGDLEKPAQKVPRGVPQVIQPSAPAIPSGTSGRLQLARWMASPENPLTARVAANRIWQGLFGRGIVSSPDNFGNTGQRPSHPELLDHLALRFVENGWSVKAMIREMVLSRTYRLASTFDSSNYTADPDNVHLWRATPRRLDAEALRDAMLVASGGLDLQRPRGSLVASPGEAVLQLRFNPDIVNRPETFRSVYLPVIRDQLPESLALFDGADPNMVTGVRDSTNVPGQALYLMNNPFVLRQAELMAARLGQEAESVRDRFHRSFLICYGRPPTEQEIASCQTFFQRFVTEAAKTMDLEKARTLAFTTFCQGLFASAEFRFLN
ncbi:MAG: Protein of unknown function DUF1553/DUF1549/Planctomycete cytochrome C [Verrucomicrobia bacterium]|jgi:hypothetical protein|nr:MAG: Protein of unknown function DUF1553/DUF1549/Planctomycete cytochrome C [Verrucomicrobiota bacterium]